jgi:excisionase family DNA binding protein
MASRARVRLGWIRRQTAPRLTLFCGLDLNMSAFRVYIKQRIRQVESWLDLPPGEANWLQVVEDCRWILAQVEQQATLAGVPGAVAACQVKGEMISVEETRRILATCLAACPEPERTASVLLTVKEAAIRYNIGERTLYRLLESGDLRNCGHGRSKRIKPADLQRYLEAQDHPQAAQESLFG